MHKIILPKFNNNDDSYLLLEWLVENGQTVKPAEDIAIFETSKAAFDLSSEAEGILHYLPKVGDECSPGDLLGYIFATEAERQDFLNRPEAQQTSAVSSFTITKAAEELMQQHGIAETDLVALGKAVIKKTDIEAVISQRLQPETIGIEVSRHQVAIAQTVSHSHTTIPKAFLLTKVYCDAANQALQTYSAAHDVMVGLSELLIQATGHLCAKFPFFFGQLVSESCFVPAEAAHVGLTLDLGRGLFIPVVKAAGAQPLAELANLLMEFRMKAMRGAFKEEELNGGNISISLNMDADTVLVLPIILPGQTCMISLAAMQEEVYLDAHQTVATRSYVHLGLAYDHRVINGRDAAQFLGAIKAVMESPTELL